MKRVIALLIISILFLPNVGLSQGDFGDEPDAVPIDGGISLLVAAGVAYGIKHMKEKKRYNEAKD